MKELRPRCVTTLREAATRSDSGDQAGDVSSERNRWINNCVDGMNSVSSNRNNYNSRKNDGILILSASHSLLKFTDLWDFKGVGKLFCPTRFAGRAKAASPLPVLTVFAQMSVVARPAVTRPRHPVAGAVAMTLTFQLAVGSKAALRTFCRRSKPASVRLKKTRETLGDD